MPMEMKSPPSNTLLIGIVAGCVVLLAVVLLFMTTGGGGDNSDLDAQRVTVAATVEPSSVGGRGEIKIPEDGSDLVVYLDVSHPMGGFLPPPSVQSPPPGLATVAQLLPGYLVRAYGGATQWKTVANSVRPLPGTPHFGRSLFRGSETFLEPAVEEILQGLESGHFAAAMLLTDLVATSGPESAMAVARPLAPWLRSAAVQSGIFDAGLLGVRTTFWGVRSSSCPALGEVGCWYSEQADQYLPLSEPVQRPFYVLILGRTDGDTDLVNDLGEKLRDELKALEVETQWERFTERRGRRSGTFECSLQKHAASAAPGEKQYILVRNGDGTWQCQQEKSVELICDLKPEGASSRLPLQSGESSWPWVETWVVNGAFHAVVDCARMKKETPHEDLRFEKLHASAPSKPPQDWSSWTAYSDEQAKYLTGTLQLDLFLEKLRVRPDRYRVELADPILKVTRDDE